VALVPAAGEHGDHVGDDAEGRHGRHVQRRLPEHPDDPVVHAGGAAQELLAVAQVEVGEQQHATEHGEREQPHRAAHHHRPREQRRAAQGHARSPQGEHGGDHRDRGDGEGHGHRDQAGDVETHRVELGAVGAAVDGVRGEHEAARHQPHPVGGRAGPGEGDRRRPHLQWHDRGGQADEQRQHAEEQQRRLVQREDPDRRGGPEDLAAGAVVLLDAHERARYGRGDQEQQ
jgi:hypothetical protein